MPNVVRTVTQDLALHADPPQRDLPQPGAAQSGDGDAVAGDAVLRGRGGGEKGEQQEGAEHGGPFPA